MRFNEEKLAPFAQLVASKSLVRSVYVDIEPGELHLLVQMLNVANFGTTQGYVDELKFDANAGEIYHIATGLEAFRGFKTYSGIVLTDLPRQKFNRCHDLKKQNFDADKILSITTIHGEIISCAGVIEAVEKPTTTKRFSKWVLNRQQTLREALEERRKINAKRNNKI